MYLTKISLRGFKSFADEVNIEFPAGVIGIVGPNGCGKSNVSDAIRWVLGDNSSKALRGGSTMVDVIFSGTDFRKSLSFCEVSLFFDNVDRYYDIDADEVVITRRLYRSSGSEYCINGQTVRMRDVLELLRDTGLGKEGYSIIEQGKTAAILSKKPEERRKIFEEAAGVAGFRDKKEDAERQLDKARLNKDNLFAFLTELENRLPPLEKQAKVAIKVKDLKEQLKIIEVNTYLHQSEDSSGVTSKLQNAYNAVVREIEEKEAEYAENTRNHNLAFADLNNISIVSERIQNERTELLISREKSEGANRLYTEKIERATEELDKLGKEISSNTILKENKLKEKLDKEIEKEKKTKAFIELNVSYGKEEEDYNKFAEEVDKKERELERSRELILESQDELTNAKSATVGLVAKRDVLLESLGDDKELIKEKRSRLAACNKEIEALEESLKESESELSDRLNEYESAKQNLQNCLAELDETNIRLREQERESMSLETRINILSESKNRLDNYADSVRCIVRAASQDLELNRSLVGVVGEMITVPRDLQLAIEIALGGNIQNIITYTQKDAATLIDYLRAKSLGRATFLPLDSMKPNDIPDDRVLDEDGVIGVASDLIKFDRKILPAISNLLGRTVIMEDKAVAARLMRKYNFSFRAVTLDGALYQQGGAITGGKEPSKDARILGRDSELEECKKKLASVERAIDAIKEDMSDKEEESKNLQSAKNIIANRIDKVNVTIATIKANIDAKKSEARTIEEDENKTAGQNRDTLNKIKELEKLIEDSSKMEENVTSKRVEAGEFLDNMKDEVFALRQKRDTMSSRLSELKVSLNTTSNELTTIEHEITRLTADISHLESDILMDIAREKTVKKELEEAQGKIDTTKFSQDDQNKLAELAKQLDEIKAYNEELQQKLKTIAERSESINKELNTLNGKKAGISAKLERLKEDILAMETKIREEYQLDKESAEAYRVDDFDIENAMKNVAHIKSQIAGYGPVNELAVEAYAEDKQKYEDYKKQFDDVEKAENDLIKIIADLTAEMEKVFLDAFNKINENFKYIYAELFEGGRANLKLNLSEGDSVLTAPIDIEAVPKGKNLKSVGQLSGGEQALTAVGILFAIIMLKPMPFCVLDEVDAAMDDINAELFAKYLKKFVGKTQFIVITHKKPTMQMADYLYGVTMQEVGVSKVVSVQLTDAVNMAEKG